jgi:hypothetical protein
VHETAAVVEIVVQRLELGLDLDVVHGPELVVRGRPVRVDVQLEAVLEQPPEALQDPARQLRVVLLVEQVDEAGHAHHDADPLAGPFPDVGGQPVVVEVVGDQHRLAAGGEQLGPGQEIAPVNLLSAREQVPHGDLGELQDVLAGHGRVLGELGPGRPEHVDVHVRRRPEAAPLDQDRLLAQHLARLQHHAVGAEHRHAAQPELDQLDRHQPVVHAAELDAAELDHVDLDAADGQPVQQALDQLLRFVVLEERPVQQVHADDAERLLLQPGLDVEHPDVHHDLAWLVVRLGLELHAHPAVALVAAPVAARDHGVREGEEAVRVAALLAEPLDVELELLVEHALEPPHGDVPIRLAVLGVADRHVVGGDGLRDRARGPPDPEEPADDLLARPDLRDRPVPARIQVDTECLLVRIGLMSAHELGHQVSPACSPARPGGRPAALSIARIVLFPADRPPATPG